MPHENEFRTLVERLDALVPTEGAWVELWQYGGGPDEGQMTANLSGYKRFGIEFLKGCIAPEEDSIDVNIKELVTDNSSINIHHFDLAEHPSPTPTLTSLKDRIVLAGCLAMILFCFIAFLVGVGTMIEWVSPS